MIKEAAEIGIIGGSGLYEMQGFEDVTVRHTRCRAEGSPSCRWELAWKGRAML